MSHTHAERNKKYYDAHKEEICARARERRAAMPKDPKKRGRKPGPVGSYKEKWIIQGAAQATAQMPEQ